MAVVLLSAGCSPASNDTVSPTPVDPITTVASTTVAPGAIPGTTGSVADAAPTIDGVTALQSALDAVAAGYHFTTTVSVSGTEALRADGDRVGDGTRLSLTGNGASVAYVITPAGTWVQPEDGTWEALDTPPANSDPIAALRSPSAVTVLDTDGTITRITATVPAVALGVPSAADATADVLVTLTNGSLTTLTYSSAVEGASATVEAQFGPVADATPITAPV